MRCASRATRKKGAAVATPDYVLGNTASETFNGRITAGYSDELFGQAVDAKLSLRHHQARLGVCYCLANDTPSDLLAQVTTGSPRGAENWKMRDTFDRPTKACRTN